MAKPRKPRPPRHWNAGGQPVGPPRRPRGYQGPYAPHWGMTAFFIGLSFWVLGGFPVVAAVTYWLR